MSATAEAPAPEQVDLDSLLDRYLEEAEVEAEAEEREKIRLRAAFEAGAPLVLLQPTELWDPIDRRTVRVGGGTVVTVAEHEGDILIGKLADNSHSLGVVYEEPERWYPRKYFLPLAILVDRLRVRTDDPEGRAKAQQHGLPVRGMEQRGVDEHTSVAVRRIEELALRDEYATLPRGTVIHLRRGGTAKDAATGAEVPLPPGTRCEVTEAVGDFSNPDDAVAPDIPILVEGRPLRLGFDQLMLLDFQQDVLSPRAQEALRDKEMARREALRRLVGIGLGVAFVAGGGAWYLTSDPYEKPAVRRRAMSLLIPEIAFLHGYFRAGGKYWFDLKGIVMDLKAKNALEPARRLRELFREMAAVSGRLNEVYRDTYYRSVHVGWSETKHYRTDKDGKRHYTHSTWSKVHRTMWLEPGGLEGRHPRVAEWAHGDEHRHRRAVRLTDERIFNLLEADADDPEKDFSLQKQQVGFGRDAAMSALAAALIAAPPAFYDTFAEWASSPATSPVRPAKGLFGLQKETLMLAGVISGAVLAHRHAGKLNAQLHQNKYDLGQELERQIKRVPGLNLEQAWIGFFGTPAPDALPGEVRERGGECRHIADHAIDFTYVYGSGWDHGRPLDPERVDSSRVRQLFAEAAPVWPRFADRLRAFLGEAGVRDALLPLLRNAVGTEILDAQMKEDRAEAHGGALRNAAWFALPLWGTAVLDGLVKAMR